MNSWLRTGRFSAGCRPASALAATMISLHSARLSLRLHNAGPSPAAASARTPIAKNETFGRNVMAVFVAVRRAVLLGLSCIAALAVSNAAFAQQYPDKPVKIVIPFPAGGVTDIAGRLIAQKLSEKLGQQFYIENIAGAG